MWYQFTVVGFYDRKAQRLELIDTPFKVLIDKDETVNFFEQPEGTVVVSRTAMAQRLNATVGDLTYIVVKETIDEILTQDKEALICLSN